jgi:hypothetical protein
VYRLDYTGGPNSKDPPQTMSWQLCGAYNEINNTDLSGNTIFLLTLENAGSVLITEGIVAVSVPREVYEKE